VQCTEERLGGNDTYESKVKKGIFSPGHYCYNNTEFKVLGSEDSYEKYLTGIQIDVC
jgi:hypothetical protein